VITYSEQQQPELTKLIIERIVMKNSFFLSNSEVIKMITPILDARV
jgi:hypothetical protein